MQSMWSKFLPQILILDDDDGRNLKKPWGYVADGGGAQPLLKFYIPL